MQAAIQGLVSTIIPTFNRRALLPRAIDSALAQTWPSQEIIVIDDGSTDGTAGMLAERYGSRIRCVSQPNGGVSSARNLGMGLAEGEFIALLDSDDTWAPQKLDLQVKYLQARPAYGMVLCDVQRVDGNFRPVDVLRRREALPVDGDVLADVLMMPTLVPASVLMRRTVFESVGGFDTSLRTAEDIDFHLRVASRFPVGSIDEPLVCAMRGHEGLSSDAGTQSDYVSVMERFVRAHASEISGHVGRRALLRAYFRNAHSAIASGRPGPGLRFLGRALRGARNPGELREAAGLLWLLVRVSCIRAARAFRRRG